MNDPDALQRSLYAKHRGASRDNRVLHRVRNGTSSSSGDDGMRSSDASTNRVPSSCERTTNSGNTPSTRANAMRTMRRTRTNHRSQDDRHIRVR